MRRRAAGARVPPPALSPPSHPHTLAPPTTPSLAQFIVWCILIAVFIFYALLVLLVVSVACCGGSVKPAPAAKDDNGKPIAATGAAAVTGYASTAWSFVLNFFGLDDLTPEPAPPATGGAKAAAEPTTDASASLLASSASA